MRLLVILATAMMFACFIGSCGSKNASSVMSPNRTSSFALEVLDESYLGNGSAGSISIDKTTEDGIVTVSVNAQDAVGLKALYVKLHYNTRIYSPVSASTTDAIGPDGELISLTILDQPGTVHHGQVLANWDKADGYTGSGELAMVKFALRPAELTKAASTPPDATGSRALLSVNETTGDAEWYYCSVGDYDQNGEVNITDLTNIGLFYNESALPDKFAVEDVRSVVDGDNNGQININDLTPIGANFGRSTLGGYNLYYSNSEADGPLAAGDPNGAGATQITHLDFNEAIGSVSTNRLMFSSSGVPEMSVPGESIYLWVRPTDGTTEGIASNILQHPPTTGLDFSISNPPDFGNGSLEFPYYLDVETGYELVLTDETDGDVGTDANTTYTLDPPEAGTVETGGETATLDIDDNFKGLVNISASYGEKASTPDKIYCRIPDHNSPILNLEADPEYGDGSSMNPFVVDVDTVYRFSLFSIVAGNVAAHADTVWRVSEETAGGVVKGASTATLDIEDGFQGTFNVGATYKEFPSEPLGLYFLVPDPNAPVLALANEPPLGDGTQGDPYQVNLTTDYILTLTHPVNGDVATDFKTIWAVSAPAVGQVDTSGAQAVLNIDDAYNGTFSVYARHDGIDSIPRRLWFEATGSAGNIAPEASLTTPSANVNVDTEISFDASGSTDSDGTIESYSYDWDGDGEYEIEESSEATMNHTYYWTGNFNPTVLVKDNQGGIDTASVSLTVSDGGNMYPTVSMTADKTTGEVPITINFDASASTDDVGITNFSWDLDGDDIYETNTGTTATTSYEYTEDGNYLISVKGYDAEGEWDFDEVELTLTLPGGNMTPIASLTGDTLYGQPGLMVNFNAGDSSDPNGDSLTFTWDLDGDGTFETDTGSTFTTSHTYNTEGNTDVVVKATDTGGAFDTATVRVTIDDGVGQWHIYSVVTPSDPVLAAGSFNCLRVIDGYPAIAYQDTLDGSPSSKGRAMYVRALDANGDTWGDPVVIRTPTWGYERSGIMIDMEIVDGNPAVCWCEYEYYSDQWQYSLYYERAEDATGSDWGGTLQAVDVTDNENRGNHCNLAVISGNPAISYFNATGQQLMYARADDATGSSWGAPLMVFDDPDDGDSAGEETSLAMVSGRPAIVTLNRETDGNTDKLLYFYGTDVNGTAFGTPAVLDTRQSAGFFNSLVVHMGVPVLGSCNFNDGQLLCYTANDATGASWKSPVVAATDSGDMGPGNSCMAIINGVPMFSYTNDTMFSSTLKFVRATSASGDSWQSAETIETVGFMGSPTSCFEVNGHPAVSYCAEETVGEDLVDVLKYAVYY